MAVLSALFACCVEITRILDVDGDFAERCATARARLLPPRIGRHGQIQEWEMDYEEAQPGHHHLSHLFGLHPGHGITPRGTPELARADPKRDTRGRRGGSIPEARAPRSSVGRRRSDPRVLSARRTGKSSVAQGPAAIVRADGRRPSSGGMAA